MFIDRNYIMLRYRQLLEEKQKELQKSSIIADKRGKLKYRFPQWLRKIVFHPYNPAYSMFLQLKAQDSSRYKTTLPLDALHPYATDFLDYIISHDLKFDSSLYFHDKNDDFIRYFLDCRIKSLIPGYNQITMNKQQQDVFVLREKLKKSTQKTVDGYTLTSGGEKYFLPKSAFSEHSYIHDYGLKHLPESVKKYIAGKVFLDLGAYVGDTALMLSKRYNPKQIYAFEPVGINIALLKKTIAKNSANNIILVQKGIGSEKASLDILINENNLASCTINKSLNNTYSKKETVEITTIDSECTPEITVGLIKMDIEGLEYAAITGGLETIKRDRPVLLVSIYHTAKDFFEIPELLKQAVPSYTFSLFDLDHLSPLVDKILVAYPSELQ
ncbi:MAG: FkbM family methyltransferase [Prevotella sp.]|jgi:FkbM family methyltransferase|nr:FkbM family methyltransferase [Prevotella sp.]